MYIDLVLSHGPVLTLLPVVSIAERNKHQGADLHILNTYYHKYNERSISFESCLVSRTVGLLHPFLQDARIHIAKRLVSRALAKGNV